MLVSAERKKQTYIEYRFKSYLISLFNTPLISESLMPNHMKIYIIIYIYIQISFLRLPLTRRDLPHFHS